MGFQKGNTYGRLNLGKKFTEEHKQNLKKAWKTRKPITEETREKMRLAHLGNKSHTGLKASKETLMKLSKANRLEKNSNWKGGIKKDRNYILVNSPDHPYKNSYGYVYQHRLVIEEAIGRYLESEEVIHHINGNASDNRIENLMLFASQSEHLKYYKKQDKLNVR